LLKECDRQSVGSIVAFRIADPMLGRNKTVICPLSHQVANINYKASGLVRDIDPVIVKTPNLKP
jgi:hypothetical protein